VHLAFVLATLLFSYFPENLFYWTDEFYPKFDFSASFFSCISTTAVVLVFFKQWVSPSWSFMCPNNSAALSFLHVQATTPA
jgi:hypothetical protein